MRESHHEKSAKLRPLQNKRYGCRVFWNVVKHGHEVSMGVQESVF